MQEINWEATFESDEVTKTIEFLIGLRVPFQVEYPEKDQIKISFQKKFNENPSDSSTISGFEKLISTMIPKFKRITKTP